MRIEQFLIGIVIFSAILVSGTILVSDINSNYDTNIEEGAFANTLNNISETYELSKDLKEKTIDADISTEDTESALFSGGFTGAREQVSKSTGIVSTAVSETGKALDIPAAFSILAMTALAILVLFALIYLVFRIVR